MQKRYKITYFNDDSELVATFEDDFDRARRLADKTGGTMGVNPAYHNQCVELARKVSDLLDEFPLPLPDSMKPAYSTLAQAEVLLGVLASGVKVRG